MGTTADNPENIRYLNKYIKPYFGLEDARRMRLDFAPFSADQTITVHDYQINDGKIMIEVTNKDCLTPQLVPLSKINKYSSDEDRFSNKGIRFEEEVVQTLNQVGSMNGSGAGCRSPEPDGHLIKEDGSIGTLEIKREWQSAKVGQFVLRYEGDQWQVTERSVAKAPHFTELFLSATSNGKPLLQVVNESVRKPEKNEKLTGFTIRSDHFHDMEPVRTYISDKGIDVLYIGNRGLFGETDFIPELQMPKGVCEITVRGKDKNSLTVEGIIKKIEKSEHQYDLTNIEEAKRLKGDLLGKSQKIDSNFRQTSKECQTRSFERRTSDM